MWYNIKTDKDKLNKIVRYLIQIRKTSFIVDKEVLSINNREVYIEILRKFDL